ncbi:MAG TPA: ATP-binding cassette domain-containing protein [Mycobacterium sp.]|nr:ATP-binding cassette domain-containing protein [Mycobacterium sp.]
MLPGDETPTLAMPATLSRPQRIGRRADCDIVVHDPLVSRVHANLVKTPAGLEIADNASINGTFVNGRRVTRVLVRDGDIVTVGNTDFAVAGATLVPRPATWGTGGVQAYRLGLRVDGNPLLTGVSFTARPGSLTAVIGPSGAGKSTLIKLLGGAMQPTLGRVIFDGHDVHAEYASMRSRIGVVPQDDVVHRRLTVEQALGYAAELRLPPDTSAADRRGVVDRVIGELELSEHRKTRIDNLSGGQRKRASVAMELLTGPSLLILDEPTSGLDPALDRQVMTMLRRLADADRVVVVVTHSLTYLQMCDQVLLLTSGGKTAFAGPPGEINAAMGSTDWADIFAFVSTDPDSAHRRFLDRQQASGPIAQPPAAPPGPPGSPARTSRWRQISSVARRQGRLILADRGYFVFLALLPFILGALTLVVPGDSGFGPADPRSDSPDEASEILLVLLIAAVFMGTALTIRDLVGERAIFRREQSVGLSASAYLTAKVIVYSLVALIQTAVLTAIVILGKGAPTQGALVVGNPVLELYLALAVTTVVSAVIGLALSSLARSTEQILPLLVVVIMVSLVFSGGMFPITGRIGLDQLSWYLPSRWGFAAAAATVDLIAVDPLASHDQLWTHAARWWWADMICLVLLGVVWISLVRWRLRLPSHR